MELWLDAHISPRIAKWINDDFSFQCFPIRDLDLLRATDVEIFNAAKKKGKVVIITKDDDFSDLVTRLKSPPKIIWLTFGNCSNSKMKEILKRDLLSALAILEENELVEISA
jgi:predicted nuclease of predicted toxin-antitoxin system